MNEEYVNPTRISLIELNQRHTKICKAVLEVIPNKKLWRFDR